MKKLLALLLALVMVLSLFAACGSDDEDEKEEKKETTSEEQKDDKEDKEEEKEEEKEDKPAKKDDAEDVIAEFVETNGAALAQTWAASAGIDCEIEVEAEDCGIVINLLVTGLDDVPDETKEQIQATYDSAAETYSAMMDIARAELPELEFMTVNYCEEDGDIVASLTIE